MRVGSTKRVSGYQWNSGTILFTILSGVYLRAKKGGAVKGSVRHGSLSARNTLCLSTAESHAYKGPHQGPQRIISFSPGPVATSQIHRLDWFLHGAAGNQPKLRIPSRSTPTKQRESNELVHPDAGWQIYGIRWDTQICVQRWLSIPGWPNRGTVRFLEPEDHAEIFIFQGDEVFCVGSLKDSWNLEKLDGWPGAPVFDRF